MVQTDVPFSLKQEYMLVTSFCLQHSTSEAAPQGNKKRWAQFRDKCPMLFFWPNCEVCGILVPQPGYNPWPLQWKHGVLATGPPQVQMSLKRNETEVNTHHFGSHSTSVNFDKRHSLWVQVELGNNTPHLGNHNSGDYSPITMEEEGFGGQMIIAMAVYPSGHHLPSLLPKWNILVPQGWQPAAFSLKVQDPGQLSFSQWFWMWFLRSYDYETLNRWLWSNNRVTAMETSARNQRGMESTVLSVL